MLVVVPAITRNELASNFTAGEQRRMNVCVDDAVSYRPQYFVKLSHCNPLGTCAANYISRGNGASDRAVCGTRLSSRRSIAQIGAKEDHNASVNSFLSEMNVRLSRSGPGDAGESQFISKTGFATINHQTE